MNVYFTSTFFIAQVCLIDKVLCRQSFCPCAYSCACLHFDWRCRSSSSVYATRHLKQKYVQAHYVHRESTPLCLHTPATQTQQKDTIQHNMCRDPETLCLLVVPVWPYRCCIRHLKTRSTDIHVFVENLARTTPSV